MALGFSLFLIAAGAILALAVDASVQGLDIAAVGVILMVVGGLGLLMSLLFWTSFAPFGRHDTNTTVIDDRRGSSHHHDTV
jgi:hypothetical protein